MTSKHIPFRLIDDRPRGPIVNVAFTIDGECVDLLHRAGKNRSRTVRNAIKRYLRGDYTRQDRENDHAELMERYQRVLGEREKLKKEIESFHLNSFKGCTCISTSRHWKPKPSLVSRFAQSAWAAIRHPIATLRRMLKGSDLSRSKLE